MLSVIVTLLSDTTTSSTPTFLAMVITLITLLLPQNLQVSKKKYLELTIVNQNQVATLWYDLHIKDLIWVFTCNGSSNRNSMDINCSHVYEATLSHFVTLDFPTWALEAKAVFLSGMSTRRDHNQVCSMTGSLRPFSEEAPILDLLHDYVCSKICIVVTIHGACNCNLIESIPFEMNNFLVILGDGFWCQKGGHPFDCFSLTLSLQFIRQPLINPLSVCSLRFGNKHAILMTNVATPNIIRYSSRRSIILITLHENYISRTQNNTLFIFAAVYGHSSATSAVFSSIPNSHITVHHVI